MVTSLFYLGTRATAVAVVEEASARRRFGHWSFRRWWKLDASDFKAELAAAAALGRIGADAIEPLLGRTRADEDHRVFILRARQDQVGAVLAVPALLR